MAEGAAEEGMVQAIMYSFLGDLVLVVHASFIVFVVLGFVLIPVGSFRHWNWVRNLWFRLTHLVAIAIVVVESWFGEICPLTDWENRLREAAGGTGYSESFIQHWLQKILFYDLAPLVFTAVYTIFAILVLLAWVLVPPRLVRR